MSIILLLALQAASQTPADGPHAIRRMESIIAAFGEPRRLRLQGLSSLHGGGSEPWYVKLSEPNNITYEGWIGGPEGQLKINRVFEENPPDMGFTHPVVDHKEEKAIQSWLSKMKVSSPTRLISLSASKDNRLMTAYVALLRDGYPFVSFPQYGYRITYTVSDHKLLSLTGLEFPPDADGVPPKLNEQDALADLAKIWDTEIAAPAIRDRHWKRVWYELIGKPELGYYLQKGRSKAGLVWRISFMSYREVTLAIQGGDSGMLIDAVTGRRIQTDTVP